MESFIALADLISQSSLHDVAYSALPNAPVLPYAEPRRRARRLIATLRSTIPRRHEISMRPARYNPGC
jgi:hypothetical protein